MIVIHRRSTAGRDRSRRSCSSRWSCSIVVLDVIVEGYEVSPPVLVPLLLTAAGLLSVDLPRVRP